MSFAYIWHTNVQLHRWGTNQMLHQYFKTVLGFYSSHSPATNCVSVFVCQPNKLPGPPRSSEASLILSKVFFWFYSLLWLITHFFLHTGSWKSQGRSWQLKIIRERLQIKILKGRLVWTTKWEKIIQKHCMKLSKNRGSCIMQKISTFEVNKNIYVSNAVHAVEIIPFIWYAPFLMREFESQNTQRSWLRSLLFGYFLDHCLILIVEPDNTDHSAVTGLFDQLSAYCTRLHKSLSSLWYRYVFLPFLVNEVHSFGMQCVCWAKEAKGKLRVNCLPYKVKKPSEGGKWGFEW